jgi:hypothetical protein
MDKESLLQKTAAERSSISSPWQQAGTIATVKPISNEAGVFPASLSRMSVLAANAAVASMFLMAYVALEWVSFIHEHKGLTITPWNPGLGVVFALMVLVGSRAGFILFTGVVAAEIFVLQSNLEWPIVIGVGAITSLSYAFVATVARRHLRLDVRLVHLRDVLVLLAVGLAGAAIDTVLLIVFLLAFGQLEMRDVASASVPLLVGDIIGIAVMTPLLLQFVFRRREIVPRRLLSLAPEGVLYVPMIGASTLIILLTVRPSLNIRVIPLLIPTSVSLTLRSQPAKVLGGCIR